MFVCVQGPPANQETRDKASKLTGFPDDDRMKTKRCKNKSQTFMISALSVLMFFVFFPHVLICPNSGFRGELAEKVDISRSFQRHHDETDPTQTFQVMNVVAAELPLHSCGHCLLERTVVDFVWTVEEEHPGVFLHFIFI